MRSNLSLITPGESLGKSADLRSVLLNFWITKRSLALSTHRRQPFTCFLQDDETLKCV